MTTIAIHQCNFIPWFPYFEKMNQADIFCLLMHCQFEKNGWTNRCKINDKWWTNPVTKGEIPIVNKQYTDGTNLAKLNSYWIFVIAKTLGIDTDKIVFDFPTPKKGTERLIEICKHYKADGYLTNPGATDKYLDEKMLNDSGIKLMPFKSKNKRHVFEMFQEFGIEGTRKLLNRGKKDAID